MAIIAWFEVSGPGSRDVFRRIPVPGVSVSSVSVLGETLLFLGQPTPASAARNEVKRSVVHYGLSVVPRNNRHSIVQ